MVGRLTREHGTASLRAGPQFAGGAFSPFRSPRRFRTGKRGRRRPQVSTRSLRGGGSGGGYQLYPIGILLKGESRRSDGRHGGAAPPRIDCHLNQRKAISVFLVWISTDLSLVTSGFDLAVSSSLPTPRFFDLLPCFAFTLDFFFFFLALCGLLPLDSDPGTTSTSSTGSPFVSLLLLSFFFS